MTRLDDAEAFRAELLPQPAGAAPTPGVSPTTSRDTRGTLMQWMVAADAAAKADRLAPSKGTIVGGPEQVADGLREYADAGAEWIIVGPVDSADPENASMVGQLVAPLLT